MDVIILIGIILVVVLIFNRNKPRATKVEDLSDHEVRKRHEAPSDDDLGFKYFEKDDVSKQDLKDDRKPEYIRKKREVYALELGEDTTEILDDLKSTKLSNHSTDVDSVIQHALNETYKEQHRPEGKGEAGFHDKDYYDSIE